MRTDSNTDMRSTPDWIPLSTVDLIVEVFLEQRILMSIPFWFDRSIICHLMRNFRITVSLRVIQNSVIDMQCWSYIIGWPKAYDNFVIRLYDLNGHNPDWIHILYQFAFSYTFEFDWARIDIEHKGPLWYRCMSTGLYTFKSKAIKKIVLPCQYRNFSDNEPKISVVIPFFENKTFVFEPYNVTYSQKSPRETREWAFLVTVINIILSAFTVDQKPI